MSTAGDERSDDDGGDPDTERTSVTTYVPRYQKKAWDDHADELGVSRSEFVAMMVQAGRRDLLDGDADGSTTGESTTDDSTPGDDHGNRSANVSDGTGPATAGNGGSPDATPGVEGVKDRILDALREGDRPDWEELVERVVGDVESDVDEVLGDLQAAGRVRYSGRHDGYVLVDGGD